MAAKKSNLSTPDIDWCLENKTKYATLSFIYSLCLPLTSFKKLPSKDKWQKEVDNFGRLSGYKDEELKCGVGIPCFEAKPEEKDGFIRKGFEPILNDRFASNNQHWFCGNLNKRGGVGGDVKCTTIDTQFDIEAINFLVRFNGIGVCTVTLIINLQEPTADQLFTVLDLVRKEPPSKIKLRFSWDKKKEKGTYALNDIFQYINEKIIKWRVGDKGLSNFLKSENKNGREYQCPYVVSYIKLKHEPVIEKLPWEPEDFFYDHKDKPYKKKCKKQFLYLTQILAILIRPKIWRDYYKKEFKAFRAPYHLLKKHWFASHDFFWDKRGVILFDTRSTLFLDALPEPKNGDESVSKRTFSSLMDILETIRARWHFYIKLNNELDSLTNNLEDSNSLLSQMASLRKIFTKSLTYTLPYSQTASHLVELATKAEKELMVEELERIAIRKFEAANWLYTDSIEKERLNWMSNIEEESKVAQRLGTIEKELAQATKDLEKLNSESKNTRKCTKKTENDCEDEMQQGNSEEGSGA